MFAAKNLLLTSARGPSFNSLGTLDSNNTASATSTLNIAAGDCAFLFVSSTVNAFGGTITSNSASATCDGAAMTNYGTAFITATSSSNQRLYLFGKTNPNVGAGKSLPLTISATYSGGFGILYLTYVYSFTYANITTIGTSQTATGTGTNPTQSISGQAGKTIIQCITGGGTLSGYTQTLRANPISTMLSGDFIGASGSVTGSCTQASSAIWGSLMLPVS